VKVKAFQSDDLLAWRAKIRKTRSQKVKQFYLQTW